MCQTLGVTVNTEAGRMEFISPHRSHNPSSLLFCPGRSLTCKFGLVAAQSGPCVSIPGRTTLEKKTLPLSLPHRTSHLHFTPVSWPRSPRSQSCPDRSREEMGRGVASGRLACSDWPAQHSRQPAQPPPVPTPPPPPPPPLSHHHGEIRMVPSHIRASYKGSYHKPFYRIRP